jgi:hypothetical protein
VAFGYKQALNYLHECGVETLHYLKHDEGVQEMTDARFPALQIASVNLSEVTFPSPISR